MSDNLNEIPEKTYPEEADSLETKNPSEEILSAGSEIAVTSVETNDSSEELSVTEEEESEFPGIPALGGNTELAEDRQESLSNIVIRRVRTEPVEVIPPAPKDKGFLYSLLDTVRFISLGLVIGILLVVFVVQRNDVYGPSMEPNLHEKDAVFVEMISKYFTTPERGDIMTINATGLPGYSEKEKIIKRVIGLPGETVTIKDGSVYINGVLLDEPYLAENVPTYINDNGAANGYDNITLGKDEYFFMGDNRGASLDSRVLGPIPSSRIKAHVIAKIYPFDDMGLL